MSGLFLSPKFPTVALQQSKSSAFAYGGSALSHLEICAFNIHSIYLYVPLVFRSITSVKFLARLKLITSRCFSAYMMKLDSEADLKNVLDKSKDYPKSEPLEIDPVTDVDTKMDQNKNNNVNIEQLIDIWSTGTL